MKNEEEGRGKALAGQMVFGRLASLPVPTVAAIAGQLPDGSTSVGTRVECDHLKPSLVGEAVTARATLVDVDARRLQFTVTVANTDGAAVAVARVWRVVVERDRFLDR